ncbi:YndM family protein [Pseudobacillus badius]|uniref:YndM family protein n=1 Tax=Bacillus badius TaxID=1455 RepID=UPI0024A4DB91|nr:YndM family protein [Bacillus badius]GLY09399.1 membrane protein [Bacillus badius]
MEHVKALLIKFVVVTAAVWVIMGAFYGIDLGEILTISILLTIAAYILGDLFVLPRYGNMTAVAVDFGLAYIGIWIIGSAVINENISLGWASFWTAAVIASAEVLFHFYLMRSVFTTGQDRSYIERDPAFSAEMAEETDIHKEDVYTEEEEK